MRPAYLVNFWRPVTRRLTASVALAAYLAACIGFPAPDARSKEASQPFPCQGHPCGCRTAEQCWRQCCCMSPEQRLEWARDNNVTPPAYAVLPAGGWNSPRLRDQEQVAEGCAHCTAKQGGNSLTAESTSCCSKKSSTEDCCRTEAPRSGKRTVWLLGLSALRCQGHSTLWLSVAAVVPPPPAVRWTPHFAAEGWLKPQSLSVSTLDPQPLDPPPRIPNA